MKLTDQEAHDEMRRLFTKGGNPDPDPRVPIQKANAAAFQRDLDAARYDPETKFDGKAAVKAAREAMRFNR